MRRQGAGDEPQHAPNQDLARVGPAVLVALAVELQIFDRPTQPEQGSHDLQRLAPWHVLSSSPWTTSSGTSILAAACSGEMALSSVSSRSGSPYLLTAAAAIQGSVSRKNVWRSDIPQMSTPRGEDAWREGQQREREVAPVRAARDRDPPGIRQAAVDQEVATSQDVVEGVQSAVYVVGMDERSPEAR